MKTYVWREFEVSSLKIEVFAKFGQIRPNLAKFDPLEVTQAKSDRSNLCNLLRAPPGANFVKIGWKLLTVLNNNRHEQIPNIPFYSFTYFFARFVRWCLGFKHCKLKSWCGSSRYLTHWLNGWVCIEEKSVWTMALANAILNLK